MSDDKTPDLSACEREAIHVPGSIQPHGLLLVVNPDTDAILQAAGDAAALLGRRSPLAGALLQDVLGTSFTNLVQHAGTPIMAEPTYLATIKASSSHQELTITTHQGPGVALVELEPALETTPAPKALARLRSVAERTGGASDLLDACRIAASEVRRTTGYDRVMIYQFLPDGSGSVVAEERDDSLSPFLNHRYPASDIPKQARDLYQRSPIRVIPNVNYTPAPLVPEFLAGTNQPLDMSHCTLRSISPVHIQYLKNMGVGASMSVSLLPDGMLWGLIACHNSTARLVPYEAREICRHIGQILSQYIRAREEADTYSRALDIAHARESLLHVLRESEDAHAALLGRCSQLQKVVPSHGVALVCGGSLATAGQVPSQMHLNHLAEWLMSHIPASGCFATECLSEHFAEAATFTAQASGLLSVRLSSDEPLLMMWFRAEQVEEIRWAGNPHEPLESGSSPGALNPRRSFATWEQTVWGRSRSWTAVEIESVQVLRSRAEFILQQQKLRELNSQLHEANERLTSLAATDGLTGVANRRAYDERLQAEWTRASRERKSLALLILDVDHFKQYNDYYGHGAGDECLKQIARVLRGGRRGTDLAARLGGEEFAMLLPDTDLHGAVIVAEAVRSTIENLYIEHPKSPLKFVTASIGVAAVEPHLAGAVQDLSEAADQALYQAKRTGRNVVISTGVATMSEEPPP